MPGRPPFQLINSQNSDPGGGEVARARAGHPFSIQRDNILISKFIYRSNVEARQIVIVEIGLIG